MHDYKWFNPIFFAVTSAWSSYRIFSHSFRGNYSFLNLEIHRSQYITPKVTVHKCAEIIQGRKLFKGGNFMRKYCMYVLFKCVRILGAFENLEATLYLYCFAQNLYSIAESSYNVKNELSIITSKILSKNLSNENKHWCLFY